MSAVITALSTVKTGAPFSEKLKLLDASTAPTCWALAVGCGLASGSTSPGGRVADAEADGLGLGTATRTLAPVGVTLGCCVGVGDWSCPRAIEASETVPTIIAWKKKWLRIAT
jgi:hypothetical protein